MSSGLPLERLSSKPEMFTAGNGNQYLMPTQGGKVSPMGGVGGGAGSSAAGGDVNINVQVNVASDGSGSSQSTSDSSSSTLAKQLGDRMGLIAKDAIGKEMRPGGLLWKMKVGQA